MRHVSLGPSVSSMKLINWSLKFSKNSIGFWLCPFFQTRLVDGLQPILRDSNYNDVAAMLV